jgi:hypothetical protein
MFAMLLLEANTREWFRHLKRRAGRLGTAGAAEEQATTNAMRRR